MRHYDGAERSAPLPFPNPHAVTSAPAIAIESPCIGVCTLDAAGYCIGCLRTLAEIGAWSQLPPAERRRIMDEVLPRRDVDHGLA